MSAKGCFPFTTKNRAYRIKPGEKFSVSVRFPAPELRAVVVTLLCSCGAKLIQKGQRLVCCVKGCRHKGLSLKQARKILGTG